MYYVYKKKKTQSVLSQRENVRFDGNVKKLVGYISEACRNEKQKKKPLVMARKEVHMLTGGCKKKGLKIIRKAAAYILWLVICFE